MLSFLNILNFLKKNFDRAAEMAHWLRALTALAEDQGSSPNTHSNTQPSVTLSQGIKNNLSDLLEYLYTDQTLINIKQFLMKF